MKYYLLSFVLLTVIIVTAQTPCTSGMAGAYPCDGYFLQSNVRTNHMSASSGNDSWGWTDSNDGKEYVLMGLNNGTAFIDISDPVNPIYLGKLPTHSSDSEWRDIKVYNDYAFVVSEAGGHGMQVFDLTRLRTVANPPEIFTEDAHYNGFGSAHNVVINESQPYAYGVGTSSFSGGAHFVDISDPLNPIAAGGYSSDGYSHDAQVITYNGPDATYVGSEIYIGSNEDEIVIVDVSNKAAPVGISTASYTNDAYTHQGWITDDHRYFIVGDELDEVFFGYDTRLIIMDITDLDNPVVHFEFIGTTEASDHNLYVKGDNLYLANYRGGMRVYDISDIENQNMSEIAYFDTFPLNNNTGASVGDPGAWNVYPFFDSDNIVISNYSDNGGLFLVKAGNPPLAVTDIEDSSFTLAPNPTSGIITISSKKEAITSLGIYDVSGKLLVSEMNLNALTKELNIASFSQGMYFLNLNDQFTTRIIKD